jgi:hypothetical protein
MAKTSVKIIGSKAQVFHGNATHTSGGLKKTDLVKNKHGRIVSKKKQAAGFKSIQYLIKAGYEPVKGKFGHSGGKKKVDEAAPVVGVVAMDAVAEAPAADAPVAVDAADPDVVVDAPPAEVEATPVKRRARAGTIAH